MDSIYLVSDATCKGCVYYGDLMPGTKCCNYTVDTDKLRPRGEPPRRCSVKKLGDRRKYKHNLAMRLTFAQHENCQYVVT